MRSRMMTVTQKQKSASWMASHMRIMSIFHPMTHAVHAIAILAKSFVPPRIAQLQRDMRIVHRSPPSLESAALNTNVVRLITYLRQHMHDIKGCNICFFAVATTTESAENTTILVDISTTDSDSGIPGEGKRRLIQTFLHVDISD